MIRLRWCLPALFLVSISGGQALACEKLACGEKESALIDHLVYIVPDRPAAKSAIADKLGVQPVDGGVHEHLGTANALISLGGRRYLEIAGDDETSEVESDLTRYFGSFDGPDLRTFAIETPDAEAMHARLAAEGFAVSGISEEHRVTPDGEVLNFSGFFVLSAEFRGLIPFFIDWEESPHPGTTSPEGAELVSLTALHPRSDELKKIYCKLGIDVPVRFSNKPGLIAQISSQEGTIVLQGSGGGLVDFEGLNLTEEDLSN